MIDLKAIRSAAEEDAKRDNTILLRPSLVITLLDRLEAAEKDAARYRWMRSPITSYKAVTAMVNAVDSLSEEQMDAAIDALMKDEQK